MKDSRGSFPAMNVACPGLVLLFVMFLVQGCFPYTSSFIADPTSKKTTRGVDPAAEATKQPVILVEKMPSGGNTATPLAVRAAERVSGPEAETTTVNEYKYKRHWSPLIIPVGALQLVSTPFICLGAGLDQNPNSQALDTLFAGMNAQGCETKGWARMGTYFILGIMPSCEVKASTTTKEKKLTGRTVSEDRPYEKARLRMTVSPQFTPGDQEQTKAGEGLSRVVDLDQGGKAEINVAALFRKFPRPPREVEILLALEAPAQASERVVIDEGTSEALYLPVREERLAEQAESAGNKAGALEHYGNAYASIADRDHEGALWKKITSLYRSMKPKPAVPDEARRYMVRGQTAVAEARSAADFEAAAREFEMAARQAPFWPDAYYNLGVLRGKMGLYDDAIKGLEKYLDLSPDADDAEQVKTMVYQLEYKKTKAGAGAAPSGPSNAGGRRR
jgi:hypothetical protein